MKENESATLDDLSVEVFELLPITIVTPSTTKRRFVDRQSINPLLERMYGKAL